MRYNKSVEVEKLKGEKMMEKEIKKIKFKVAPLNITPVIEYATIYDTCLQKEYPYIKSVKVGGQDILHLIDNKYIDCISDALCEKIG